VNLDELNDQMTVLAAIQQRRSEILKLEAEEIDGARQRISAMERELEIHRSELDTLRATSDQRMKEWDARIEKLVSGFGAFLAKHGG
jgi:chromosome segregation ATPase